MIHVVFQHNDVLALKKSFDLDESLRGEVVEIKDDFAVGPIKDIFSEEGVSARKEWWRGVLAGGDYDGKVDTGEVDDAATIAALIGKMREEPGEEVWIWVAPNKHDVSGYYWLVSQLKDFVGRVFLLHLHNLPFINEKGQIFYPNYLFEIPAKEFVKAKRLARQVTAAEFEIDPDEWTKLGSQEKNVRTLEGGKKLLQHDDDYYDEAFFKFITGDWQKVSRLMHSFLAKAKETTGDAFLLWRLKAMINAGRLDTQGEIRGMKDFEVKTKENIPIAP